MKTTKHFTTATTALCAALIFCGSTMAEETTKTADGDHRTIAEMLGERGTPDPAFDQKEFNFHKYKTTYDQKNRPQFHFTSKEGYINDPNGLIYYDGLWHMHFQHKGVKVWGHAVSKDLVHWTQLEHAIVPHKGSCASSGQIWSGTAIIDHDNVLGKQKGDVKTIVAFFTHTQKGYHQDGAYSTDKGQTFQLMGNLVPNLGKSTGERDPSVVWDAKKKQWLMFLTAGCKDVFKSTDLKTWTRCGETGIIGGECPDLSELPVDGDTSKMKWVMTNAACGYAIGELKNDNFVPDVKRRLAGDYARPRGSYGSDLVSGQFLEAEKLKAIGI